jgi:hypothetical protein
MATAVGTALDGKQAVTAEPVNYPYQSGYYYGLTAFSTYANSTMTQDRLGYVPFHVWETVTFDRIGIEVVTGQASTTIRLGIYETGTDGRPSALLLDAGTVDSSTSGVKEITISEELTPGLYWLASVSQGGTTQPTGVAAQNGNNGQYLPSMGNNAFVTGTTTPTCYGESGVSGALPDPSGATNPQTAASRAYRIQMRAA